MISENITNSSLLASDSHILPLYAESAQNVFDSIVFLFVTHPFDTGDRIQLDEAIMVVKRMSLLSSQFTLADGTDMYVSNALLASMMM